MIFFTIRISGANEICDFVLVNFGPLVFFYRNNFAIIVEEPIFANSMNSSEVFFEVKTGANFSIKFSYIITYYPWGPFASSEAQIMG